MLKTSLFKDGYSDIALGHCYNISNVGLGNSIDSLDRKRFHPLNIDHSFYGIYPNWMYGNSKIKYKKVSSAVV